MSDKVTPDKVTVTVSFHYGDQQTGQTIEAEPVPAAAFLRAVADQLDPPRKPMRGMERGNAGVVHLSGEGSSSWPK